MRNNFGHRIHLIAMKNQMLRLIECDEVATGQFQLFRAANRGEHGFDSRGIYTFRRLAGKSKKDSAVGAMPMAGERKRAKKINLDGFGLKGQPGRVQFPDKAKRGPHRPHGVGARWPDPNLEQFKETMLHRMALVPVRSTSRIEYFIMVTYMLL